MAKTKPTEEEFEQLVRVMIQEFGMALYMTVVVASAPDREDRLKYNKAVRKAWDRFADRVMELAHAEN